MSSIKFTPAKDETMSLECGSSGLRVILAIGALKHCSEYRITDDEKCWQDYKTDLAGLETMTAHADEALDTLMESIGVLGKALVYLDRGEMAKGEIDAIGWLISGLSDIARDIARESGEMKSSIKYLARQATD